MAENIEIALDLENTQENTSDTGVIPLTDNEPTNSGSGSQPDITGSGQCITNLSELSNLGEDECAGVYVNSLGLIHQYSIVDIQKELSKISMDILGNIHSLLCESLISIFPNYGGRRVVKRTVVRTMVSDITILGMCIVNEQTNRDLEKIFLESQRDLLSNQNGDIYSKFVDLMDTVVKLSERLQKVEEELKHVRDKGCKCERVDENSDSSNSDKNAGKDKATMSCDVNFQDDLLIPLNNDNSAESGADGPSNNASNDKYICLSI